MDPRRPRTNAAPPTATAVIPMPSRPSCSTYDQIKTHFLINPIFNIDCLRATRINFNYHINLFSGRPVFPEFQQPNSQKISTFLPSCFLRTIHFLEKNNLQSVSLVHLRLALFLTANLSGLARRRN